MAAIVVGAIVRRRNWPVRKHDNVDNWAMQHHHHERIQIDEAVSQQPYVQIK
jgi:hypothetical protein